MTVLPLLTLLLAQAAAGPTLDQDRLTVCQAQARSDPATAIASASAWLTEASGEQRTYPNECLGLAYVSLLRWQAAEQAFMAAHDARPESDHDGRARLAAMAGNAALPAGQAQAAWEHFEVAQRDAASTSDTLLQGQIAADRARALVALGKLDDAAQALADARREAPQQAESWLLSATLARRQGKLDDAQFDIQTAAALDPKDPAVGLEAGLIAALGGRDDAARASWNSVIETAPNAPEATAARDYLAQLDKQAAAK